MSTKAFLTLLWLAAVALLIALLPPEQWRGADGLTFVVILGVISGVAYVLLLVAAALNWIGNRIAG